jgi:hypothetical protein
MLERYLKIETLSIVFVGDFNPIIFQPFWLANKNLIGEIEASKADVEIVHKEVVKYELDWLSVEITKNRCQFKTSKEPYFEPLKDLAVGIFKILKETPINSLGINYIYDLSLIDEKKYYDFGSKLTPLNIWDNELNDPRLMSVEIKEESRIDNQKGFRRVRISPSDQKISYGISVNINNHFDLNGDGSKIDAVSHLLKNWEGCSSQSKSILQSLFTKIVD